MALQVEPVLHVNACYIVVVRRHHAKQFSTSSNVFLAKTESPLESQGHLPPTTFHHIQDANAQRNLPS